MYIVVTQVKTKLIITLQVILTQQSTILRNSTFVNNCIYTQTAIVLLFLRRLIVTQLN